ncbi:hypothetical protein RB653_006828 [Dictyostelium firmibasis]|uniref:UspA domain-containing protein n=1 Tax=Dictyostelium firmibasis TaxID=79012 RepID=A0AAN7TV95_9MYCE
MKFLIAIDGSSNSHKAFLKAMNLYKETDTIVLLVVVDLVHYMMSTPNFDMTLISDIKLQMFENGDSLLKKYEDLARNEYLINNVEALRVEGTPKDIIVKVVEDKSIDILCLGRVGLLNNDHITMGSTSNYCIRNCTCDILVCR